MVDSLKSATKRLDDEEICPQRPYRSDTSGNLLKKTDDGTYVFWNQSK